MKIAINAIRVSKKSGGGLETYILNITNYLAKLYPDLYVFTLYPEHFPEVKPERIVNPVNAVTQFIRVIVSTSEAISTKLSRRERDCHSLPWRPRNDIVGHPVTQENIVPDKSGDYLGRWKRILPFSGDTLRIFWTQFVLPFYLLKKYDLLFSPTQLDGLFFCPIFQVVTIHDTIPLLFPEYKHKQKVYLKYLLPKILQKTKQIITISENTKKDVVNFYSIPQEKITVIHYGMKKYNNQTITKENIEKFKMKNNLNKYILCISSNFPHKNLLRLIEAFVIIKRQWNIKLLIVGYQEKNYQKGIDRKIENLKLKDEVKLFGHFPQDKLPVIYTSAEVFVFPSLYEGFGLPPLEAMTYGCPVVVSNTSSLPEVIGNAGIYVDPYSPESIAEGITKVLSNKSLKEEIRRKGLEQVKKFFWEKAAKETLKVFEEVVRYPEPSG